MLKRALKRYLYPKIILWSEKLVGLQEHLKQERLSEQGLLSVGEHTYGNFKVDCYKGSESKLTIGKYCSISPDVRFITGGIHPTDWVALYPFRIYWNLAGAYSDGTPATKGPISVGNDVWIGTGATILSGVVIGDGAVVMARAVVTKSVQPYAIVGGVPAKLIKRRFAEDIIEKLLELKWWDWEESRILKNTDLLSSSNVQAFLERR